MGRARNIKPGFFLNELLVELSFEDRLLFIGLWTVADRDGRLEDRPKKIKMAVFPADNVDVDAGLNQLHQAGFITRYQIDGVGYIQVTNWEKHQSPHHTERASVIPPLINGEITGDPPKPHGGNPPDSLIHRFTDSLIPDSKEKAAAAALNNREKSPPSPPILNSSRAKALAEQLRNRESKRGKRCKILPSDTLLTSWLERGITEAQVIDAYKLAVEARERDKDPAPVNVGFLDLFVAQVVKPPTKTVIECVRAWHETASGIEAKGRELDIPMPTAATGGFPAFKAKVYAAAGIHIEAAA